jgi:membrane protein required for colicin V production
MNWLDAVLAIVILASVVTSFRKGLSREVIGLVSVLLALILGLWFYGTAGGYLSTYIGSHASANLVGFVLVFVCVILLGSLVSYLVGKLLRVTGLSIFDHALGALFGVVRGVLVGVALIMGMMAFMPRQRPPASIVHSRMAPYVVDAARLFAAMAPHELREGFRKTYAQVRTAWATAIDQGLRVAPNAIGEGHEKRI